MNPDPNAYRPSSLDLEDAARIKSESELESTQAHTMRNNRDLEAVMAIFGKPIPKRTRTDEERTKTTHDAPDPRDHRDEPVHHLLRLLHHDHHLVTDRPAGHVHQPAYRSRMRHHGDNPRPHPTHDNLHDHHPNERKGKTWERQSCNRR